VQSWRSPTRSGRRKFKALFYSGELIPNHWYWGNLVFDISTTKAKESTGVLLEHDPKKIVGSGKCTFGKNSMSIEGLLSAKTDAAKFVAEQADEGFPWQMSHFIEPGEIDQIKPGAEGQRQRPRVHRPRHDLPPATASATSRSAPMART
jgi:hypothetical protein